MHAVLIGEPDAGLPARRTRRDRARRCCRDRRETAETFPAAVPAGIGDQAARDSLVPAARRSRDEPSYRHRESSSVTMSSTPSALMSATRDRHDPRSCRRAAPRSAETGPPAGSRTRAARPLRRAAPHRDRRRRRDRPRRTPRTGHAGEGLDGRASVPSPLFRSTTGGAPRTPTTMSRSPSISTSAAQAPIASRTAGPFSRAALAVSSVRVPSADWMKSRTPPDPAATRSILKS